MHREPGAIKPKIKGVRRKSLRTSLEYPSRDRLMEIHRRRGIHDRLNISESGPLEGPIRCYVKSVRLTINALQFEQVEILCSAQTHTFRPKPGFTIPSIEDMQMHIGLHAEFDAIDGREGDRPAVAPPEQLAIQALLQRLSFVHFIVAKPIRLTGKLGRVDAELVQMLLRGGMKVVDTNSHLMERHLADGQLHRCSRHCTQRSAEDDIATPRSRARTAQASVRRAHARCHRSTLSTPIQSGMNGGLRQSRGLRLREIPSQRGAAFPGRAG